MRYVALIGFLFVLAGCQLNYQDAPNYKAWAIEISDVPHGGVRPGLIIANQPSQEEADNKALKTCKDFHSQITNIHGLRDAHCILYAQGNKIVLEKELKLYQIQKARETCMQIGFKENDNALNNCILEIISAKALADENINLQNQINALQNQLMFK
jgi:hypothetical protein